MWMWAALACILGTVGWVLIVLGLGSMYVLGCILAGYLSAAGVYWALVDRRV